MRLSSSDVAPVPMTVIGGFLGAGKTTLLNRILTGSHGIRFGVIVNDFGSIAVDERLVDRHEGETVSFANGCICCSLGANLVATVDQLLAADRRPEQLMIEASGVANPRAIADLAVMHNELSCDLIVVLADAETIVERANDALVGETVVMQLQSADLVVLNKRDLVADVDDQVALLSKHSAGHVVEATLAEIPLDVLASSPVANDTRTTNDEIDLAAGQHMPFDQFESETFASTAPIHESRLRALCESTGLLRAKGFIRVLDRPGIWHVQIVGRRLQLSPWQPSHGSVDNPGVVVIGIKGVIDFGELKRRLFAAV